MYDPHPEAGHWIRNNPRKAGAGILLLGGFAIYQYIVKPIQAATEHADSVSISMKMCFVAVLGIVMGLALLIGGAPVAAVLRPAPGDSKVQGFMMGGLIVATGLGVFFLLRAHLQGLGYVFQ